MIMVESRFRVANGMEGEVRTAFLNRPRLVDGVIGFLGMEVYSPADDRCVFHLVTRWTDRGSYEAWHGSDAHHHSHAFIPRGLKLDATYTRVTVLERLEAGDPVPTLSDVVTDSAPAVAGWIAEGFNTYVMRVSQAGDSIVVSRALAERLDVAPGGASLPLTSILANDEAAGLAQRIDRLRAAGNRGTSEAFLLNLVNAAQSPFTLHCRLDVQPAYTLIVAEGDEGADDRLRDELLRTNNQLAVIARDREVSRRALEIARSELAIVNAQQAATLEALNSSYWHIERIQELLPICMDCGEVRTEDGSWQHAREFLMANAKHPFLSHGYCPSCEARVLAGLAREEIAK